MKVIDDLMSRLSPLGKEKSPSVAAVLGFLLGGLGVGLYLWSLIDFVFPFGLWLLTYFVVTNVVLVVFISGVVAGVIAAIYGYFRVQNSNARLRAGQRQQPIR